MKKLFNKKNLVSLMIICILVAIPVISHAALGAQDPGDFAVSALSRIKSLIWKIATPLAAVALMVCFLIQKLSFGDQETIVAAKHWRKNIIIGYIVIMCINVIMYGIDALLGIGVA